MFLQGNEILQVFKNSRGGKNKKYIKKEKQSNFQTLQQAIGAAVTCT